MANIKLWWNNLGAQNKFLLILGFAIIVFSVCYGLTGQLFFNWIFSKL